MLAASGEPPRLGEVGRLLRAVIYTATGCELLLTLMLLPPFLSHGLDVATPCGTRSSWHCRSSTTPASVIMPEGLRPTH